MIGLGGLSAAVGTYALWATRKGRVPTNPIAVYGSLLAIGAPFVANASGWIFTEMGRQPFVVLSEPRRRPGRPGLLLHRPGRLARHHRG